MNLLEQRVQSEIGGGQGLYVDQFSTAPGGCSEKFTAVLGILSQQSHKISLIFPQWKGLRGIHGSTGERTAVACAELLRGDESSVAQVTQKVAVRIPAQTANIVFFRQAGRQRLWQYRRGPVVSCVCVSAVIAGSSGSIVHIHYGMIPPLHIVSLRPEFEGPGQIKAAVMTFFAYLQAVQKAVERIILFLVPGKL